MKLCNRMIPLALVLALAVAAVPATAPAAASFEPVAWRAGTPEQPAALLVENATLWTGGPEGRIEGGDLLIRDGEIAAVGRDLAAPAGALVIDAAGKHVTAGLVDAHSHTAMDGSTNELSNTITAEVRVEIDPDDVNIYRQLAGGLTVANVLHGSANAIGGQNVVIKLRWGAPADGLVFAAAPPGIKFALGENPKGVGDNRYPNTRQGVEQAIRTAFAAARDYQRRLQEVRDGRSSGLVPLRRDLQLEALVEVLEGKRLVHAHSYRADEILMLIRLAEEIGFRIATFQHVLEGYKVADEIAAHGAGASTFSDWWAYKVEVIDAIPFNAALMHRRGVLVSLNSDSDELARRLNTEAAKAVRYGGLSEEEALALVTLNPARQLGVGDRVGSLEVGKDADFVVWSGHPLSTSTVAEQTWIDGRKYFDRAADLERREAVVAEREELLAAARGEEDDEEADEGPPDEGAPQEEEHEEPPAGRQRMGREVER